MDKPVPFCPRELGGLWQQTEEEARTPSERRWCSVPAVGRGWAVTPENVSGTMQHAQVLKQSSGAQGGTPACVPHFDGFTGFGTSGDRACL